MAGGRAAAAAPGVRRQMPPRVEGHAGTGSTGCRCSPSMRAMHSTLCCQHARAGERGRRASRLASWPAVQQANKKERKDGRGAPVRYSMLGMGLRCGSYSVITA